ncbi:DUF6602 domain-containing protein [Hymenobacter terricola]|uniref:DUF6602 domain-containing protein n=1 Tax=Hymenobacter terricola TaxID=2819236 RepID=UPI001CF21043|nr:DUF6602 domain-containing protein [Hymenobacter terricola]
MEKYFASHQRRITEDFARIRDIYSDSAVKGSNNEKIVSEFLSEHIKCNFISNNNQIIDSLGKASDEIDVCVCNDDQPFRTKTGELILCEGVDFVVQVKAVISSNEIDRIIKNCISVKKLDRQLTLGMTAKGFAGDYEYMIQRIPYLVFAFDSKTSIEAIFMQLRKKLKSVPLHLQPDAIFVLNKGYFINLRRGEGVPIKGRDARNEATLLKGIAGFDTPAYTLLEMIRYINVYLPKAIRTHSIISYYQNPADIINIYNEELIKKNFINAVRHISSEKRESLINSIRCLDEGLETNEQIRKWTSQLAVFSEFFKEWSDDEWNNIIAATHSD